MPAIDRQPRVAEGPGGAGSAAADSRSGRPAVGERDPHREALLEAMTALRGRLVRPGPPEEVPAWPAPAAHSALAVVAERLGLGIFEQAVVVLCAGIELDAGFAEAVAAAGGPTFGVALAALPDSHWSALHPAAALRTWRLIEPADEARGWRGLTTTPLRLDEAILHLLVGLPFDDVRLRGMLRSALPDRPAGPTGPDGSKRAALAEPRPCPTTVDRLCAAWRGGASALVQLCGPDMVSACRVAAAAAERLWGADAVIVSPGSAAMDTAEGQALRVALERHAILAGAVPLIDGHDADAVRAMELAEAIRVPCAVLLRESAPPRRGAALRVEVDRPSPAEQARCWRALMEGIAGRDGASALEDVLDRVTDQFRLGATALEGAMAAARLGLAAGDDPRAVVWTACREQARTRLEDLAPRARSGAAWEDLVLPPETIDALRAIVQQARHRTQVHERWGFALRSGRGVGTTALFAGASGTGKTLAAEVIANDLGLDLHRVDLSAVVSKYIGETEKNLRRVFDAAEEGGAVLVFDEADALFGRRSEVRDSHDRYANVEVSYLLQRMDDHRGVAILTTNHRAMLDEAFLRRLRHVVEFPFPDVAMREALWRRSFPARAPVESVDFARLARIALPGGSIANIALMAAYAAAADGQVVRMSHVRQAVARELEKLERVGEGGEGERE